jgi:hypothetical protein
MAIVAEARRRPPPWSGGRPPRENSRQRWECSCEPPTSSTASTSHQRRCAPTSLGRLGLLGVCTRPPNSSGRLLISSATRPTSSMTTSVAGGCSVQRSTRSSNGSGPAPRPTLGVDQPDAQHPASPGQPRIGERRSVVRIQDIWDAAAGDRAAQQLLAGAGILVREEPAIDQQRLLPGLLAATRTGLTPAGDDELTNSEIHHGATSRCHLPFCWAHESSGLARRWGLTAFL